MKRSAGRSRGIGGSGSRGISRSSGGFKSRGFGSGFSSKGLSNYRSVNTHHSRYGRRYYGDSIIPLWVRILFYLFLMIILSTIA